MKKLVALKDLTIDTAAVVAVGRFIIPATLQTVKMYGISIYAMNVQEPLVITYDTEDERNAEYATLVDSL
jgi:hypothetical protein